MWGTAIALMESVSTVAGRTTGGRGGHGRPAHPVSGITRLVSRRASESELGAVRTIVGVLALVLAAYCLIAAATELYAQPAPDRPNPEALAARDRHQWAGLIPVVFLGLVVAYAVVVAARRRGRARGGPGPPSTQDPPPDPRPEPSGSRRDTPSR